MLNNEESQTTKKDYYWNRKGLEFKRSATLADPERIEIYRVKNRRERPHPLGTLRKDTDGTWILYIHSCGNYRLVRHDKKGQKHYVETENGAMNAIAELVYFLDYTTI